MSQVAISVQGVGKRYRLGQRERYRALRDTLSLKRLTARLRHHPGRDREAGYLWALRDVTFDVEQGEVMGIIGRNGAGKSTLLKIFSRITPPTAGTVTLYGRVGSLLEVGTGFHPELTGRENIFFNGSILGMKKSEIAQKFDEIVAFAEIEHFLDTPVKHYSTGMYMRLAFSVAAHLEPEILLVDEVLAVGDAAFQKKCLGKMGDVARSGRTVILVSHNMGAVEQLCQSALLLKGGRVAAFGKNVRQIVQDYLNQGKPEASDVEWLNSGQELASPYFKPTRFAIVDEQGAAVANPVRNDQPAWVEVRGAIERPDTALAIGYALSTASGQLLYWSETTDGPEHSWPHVEAGEWVFRSPLPSRVLNEGEYRLEMIAVLHFQAYLIKPDESSPVITLSIKGGLSDSPYLTVARDGILAPMLAWSMQPAMAGHNEPATVSLS